MARSNPSRDLSRLLTVVIAVVVIAALYLAKVVLLPLALAILFTFLLAPLVGLLEKIRLPRILAILLVILAVAAFAGTVGWAVITQLVQITDHLPDYRENIAHKIAALHRTQDTSFSRAEKEVEYLGEQLGISRPDATSSRRRPDAKPLGSTPEHPVSVREVESPTGKLGALNGVFGGMLATLLVMVFTFFILLQREDLRNRLIRLTGHGQLNLKTQAINEASSRVSRYFMLLLGVNATYGFVIFIALHFIGLPHALLFGALTALLRFIPYIGAPISALLPMALSLVVFPGWEQALLIMGIFLCVEIVTANFVEPNLFGKHTGISPLAILVAAVFWTLIWGPIGLILSVPLTVCLVVIGAHVPSLRFLKVLLGDQPVMKPEAHLYQRLLAGDEHEARQVLESYLKEKPLEDLYDAVVIPALSLFEQDRHRNDLDEETITFINETTKDLVEELGLAEEGKAGRPNQAEAGSMERADADDGRESISALKILCVPVQDEADETIAIMLAQLLERSSYSAHAIPPGTITGTLEKVSAENPDVVYLSALPPFARARVSGVYRRLRAQNTKLKIIFCLWNYAGDVSKIANQISGGGEVNLATTMAQAIAQVRPPAGVDASLQPQTVPAG